MNIDNESRLYLYHFLGAALSGTRNEIPDKPCPSTKVRKETCPNCGDTHRSNKHLYCSPKCKKEYKKE